MKKNILAFMALLCCIFGACSHGASDKADSTATDTIKAEGKTTENESHTTDKKDSLKIDIKVARNSTIIIGDSLNDIIYGDKKGNVQYGDDTNDGFNKHQVQPNISVNGVKIERNNDHRVVLQIEYSELNDSSKIKLHTAINKGDENNPNYCLDSKLLNITIIKVQKDQDLQTSDLDSIEQTNCELTAKIDRLESKLCSLEEEKNSFSLLNTLPSVIILLIGCFLFIINRKRINRLSNRVNKLEDRVKEEDKDKTPETPNQLTLQQGKMTKPMTSEEIKKFIVEQIKAIQPQTNTQTPSQSAATNHGMQHSNEKTKNEDTTIDTDLVTYHPEDNSFSIEKSDYNFFRIFSKNGEFFYTIVDNPAIRKEIIASLGAFTKCIKTETINGAANSVKPKQEGKLRKEGNKYYVDEAHKLVLQYV